MSLGDRKEPEAGLRLDSFFRARLAAAESDGPTSDEVAAYVDGSLEGPDRAAFEELLALDPALRDEVRDLQELREALRNEALVRRRWTAGAGLAAAAAAVLAAVLVWRAAPPPAVPGAPRPAPPPPLLTLRDGGREVALRADGSLTGLPGLPIELRAAVRDALRAGALPQPEGLGRLRGAPGTLLGRSGDAPFRLATPVATFVRADRPTFRWTPHPKARAYELAVFGEDLVKVAGVRVSDATEATLPSPLPRGRTYLWQVAALTAAGRQVAPAPPEPEARFLVLGAEEARALDGALAAAGDSDLVAGVVLARAGVRDEAGARLARLAAANPDSREAGRLLEAARR